MNLPDSGQIDVLISECGPRDGLQLVKTIMPTEAKKRWIALMHQTGISEIEVGSFVPAKLMPQMADIAEIVTFARTLPGLTVLALVPNLKGAEAAMAAGVHKITIPVSASEAHSLANVRKTRADMVSEVGRIVALRDATAPNVNIEVGLSVAFGCTISGPVNEDEVLRLAADVAATGVSDIGLSDTTGMANPAQVRHLFSRMFAEVGDRTGAAHMHDTRGLGLANCLAAYEAGVRIFDGSLCGLGGCQHALGATGNVVTEDLAFMFEAMGVRTGVDLEMLLAARAALTEALPDEPVHGRLAKAGLPFGFRPANGRMT